MNTNKFPRSRYLSAAVSAALSFAAASTHAAPTGGTVAGGAANATITLGADTIVDQTASTISISWDSFDVAAGESVTFNQAPTDLALNYIGGGTPSQIFGSITADGRIFLMNANGIVFGLGSTVNVGSLVATSLSNVSETGGVYTFATPEAALTQPAAITNAGTLTAASGGAIALLGGSVLNTGNVVANLGTVALGVGRAATVSFDAGGLFNFQITSALDANPSGDPLVANTGSLEAGGGQILLTAQQAAAVVGQAVNNSGVISASRIATGPGGTIRLIGAGGAVANTNTLDVSADDGAGGSVQIEGSAVTLGSGTSIDVGGSTTSGTLQVSSGSTIAAQGTLAVDGTTTLNADSTVAFGTTSAGALNVTAGDAISQSGGGITTSGLASFTTRNDGGAAITLNNLGNSFGSVQASIRDTADAIDAAAGIAITESGDTQLAGNLRTAAGQNVTVISTGDITQSGALTSAGNVSLTAGSTGSITLNQANQLSGTISFDAASASLANDTATQLGTSTIDNGLAVTSSGAISQSGSISTGGLASFATRNDSGAGIALTQTGNAFGSVQASVRDAANSNDAAAGIAITENGDTQLAGDLRAAAGQNVTIISTGNITQSGVLASAGNVSLTAGSTGSISLTTTNQLSGTVSLDAASASLVNGTATRLGESTIDTDLTVTSSGAITQTDGLTVNGLTTISASGQSVTLNDSNALSGGISVTAGSASITNSAATDLRASTTTGLLSIDSTGALTQSGNISAGSLTLASDGAVTLSADTTTTTGALTITAGAGINQTAGAIMAAGSTTLSTPGQAITLTSASNDFTGSVSITNAASAQLTDGNAIDLGASTVDGALTVNALTGDFTQSGAIDVDSLSLSAQDVTFSDDVTTGALTVAAGGGIDQTAGTITASGNADFTAAGGSSISVAQATNRFDGTIDFNVVSGTLQNVSVADTTALQLQALNTAGNLTVNAESIAVSGAVDVGGNASLTATAGDISQTDVLTVDGTTTLSAAGQTIELTNTSNAFGNSIEITAATASLTNSVATTLGTSTIGSNLTVTSIGAVDQSGALNVTGNTSINASNQDVTLDAANTFTGSVAVTAANAELTNSTATTLGASTIDNDLTVNSTGALGQSGAVSVGGDAVLTGAGVTFGTFSAGTLTVNSTAAVGQTAAISVTGSSTFNAANQDVTLAAAGNTLGGGIALTADAVTLTNTGATILQSATLTGSLTVNSNSGAVTQVDALDVDGATTIVAAGQDVALSDTTNAFDGGVGVTGANVVINNAGSVDLRASTIGGNLAVTSNTGTISQSGSLNVTGGSTFTAADGQSVLLADTANEFGTGVLLQSSGTLNDVSLAAATNLDLQGMTIDGDLTVDAATVTQSGALSVGGTATLSADAGIALNTLSADALTVNVTSGAVTQTGDLTIADTTTINASNQNVTLLGTNNAFGGSIEITAATASLNNSVATTLGTSAIGSSLTVNSTGAISQSGALNVTGGSTTLTSTGAGVTLGEVNTGTLAVNASGDVAQSVGLNVSGDSTFNATGDVTLNAANAFAGSVAITAANAQLTNSTATTLGASTIGNDLTVNSTGAIGQSGSVSVGGDAVLTGAGVTFGALTAGTLTVNSTAAVGQNAAISVTGGSTFNAAGQDVTLATAGNTLGGGITLTAANAVLTNTGATNLQASTLTGSLTVNSTGAITQSGALNVAGIATLGAGGQDIMLSNTANTFGSGVAVTGRNVTLVDDDSIDLRASTVSGNLDVTSLAGTITQSGALNVAGSSTFTAADGQSILLTDTTNVFGGVLLASSGQLDDVSLAAASGLDLQGLDIAGDLAVATGGSLTQSGALVVAGDADFRTLNTGSNIALTGANRFGSVSATGAGGVSITQGTGDLNLRQVTAAGSARLEAGNGSIVDDATDPAAASVNAASVELVALNNIGTVTDLLTRQGTAIAVNTNGGALAARVAGANGQINLALPGGSAPTAAAGAISASGSGRLLIQSAGDLSLNSFNAAITGFSEVGFSADGTLSMPGAQADLIAGPLTTFYLRGATDIARADRTFNLSASHLIFDSGSQGGDVALNTTADRLDASVGGSASLTVQNTGDLTLGTIGAGNNVTIGAANIRDDGDAGGVTRVTAGNAIALNAGAAIGEADGAGGGRIDTTANSVVLNAGAGAVYLSHAGDLQVSGNAAAGAIDVVAPTGNITVASTLRANGPLSLTAGTDGAVTGNITLAGSVQSTGTATLTAANGGTIADANDAATHLAAQTANLNAAAVGSQANALNVEVGTLNATVGNDLYVSAANALRLGTIAATSASIGATGAITDDGDDATRITAQSLALSGTAIGAAGAGNEIDTTVGVLSATASAGGIYVGASGDVQLATLSAAGNGNDIVVTAGGAIGDDGDVATRISGGTLTLNAASIGAAGAGLGTQVTALNAAASGGGVFVNEADDLQLNSVSGTDVVLTAGGALTDDSNDATRISGTNVSLTAARIGTADNRIDTAAGSLSAIATAGGVFAAEQDDVALTEVRASGTGNMVDIRTGGNGSMTVQTLVTQGGAVTLTSGGTGSITVTGAIESNNGVVNLISGNALALPGLDTGTGSVTLRTVNDLNVGTITASSLSITSDTGNVSLGTIDATGGTVTVTANNGTITDGDSTSLTARDATLTAQAIGGPDQALNLAVDNLTATASGGGIYINDIGSLALNAINANGAVSIVTTGALTQNAGIASHGADIEVFADSISMLPGATTLSGNGNISYVANGGAISLESLDAATGRVLVIAADSVYSTLDPNAGINNLSGSIVEIRAGGLGGGAGEIGTLENPINISTSGSSDRSLYLIVPAVNGIQTTTPSINYTGSSASLLLKGYTGSTGTLLFDLSSTFSPETILSGDETIVPLQNGRVAVNSDSLSAAKQALSSGVVARINVDWAAFDPNVSLFGTLDPSLKLPADQVDEEVPMARLIPEGTVLLVSRDGWVLRRAI